MTESNATDPSAVVAVAAAPAAAPSQPDPAWINDRIAQAKRSAEAELLKTLGVTDVEAAKVAVAAAKAADDAKKSAETRAAEAASALEAEKARSASLAAAVKAQADAAMKDLKPEQLAAVQSVAGEDPAKQLSALAALRPTWTTTVAAVPPPTASTAPPRAAPPENTSAASPDHASIWRSLRESNPFAAAQYRKTHEAAISAAESKKT